MKKRKKIFINFLTILSMSYFIAVPCSLSADIAPEDILGEICNCLDKDYQKAHKPQNLNKFKKECVQELPRKLMKNYNNFAVEEFNYLLVYDYVKSKIIVNVKYKDKEVSRVWSP